jgi:hypothetical protein
MEKAGQAIKEAGEKMQESGKAEKKQWHSYPSVATYSLEEENRQLEKLNCRIKERVHARDKCWLTIGGFMLEIPSLAACGWLLMYNPTENLKLPITEWEQSLAFDTAAECETFIATRAPKPSWWQLAYCQPRRWTWTAGESSWVRKLTM